MNPDGGAGVPGTVTTNDKAQHTSTPQTGPIERLSDDRDNGTGLHGDLGTRRDPGACRGERAASGSPVGTEPQATGIAGRALHPHAPPGPST
jgi:hypothetical protein